MATYYLNNCGALIYCTKTKRYLFLLRQGGRYTDTWGIVGGKIENNESIMYGLKREIQEELGGEIVDSKCLPLEKYTSENKKFVYHTFLIKVEEEFVPDLNSEHKGYCWTSIENCPKPMHPGLKRSLEVPAIMNKLKLIEQVKD